MKTFKALLLSLIASSAFAAGGIGVIQGDAVTFSSAVITGAISLNGTCTGTGCGGGGGASTLGVNYGGVSVTTPTAQINFVGPLRATANTSTATITLDAISLSTAVTGTLPVANGGTGTTTPNLVAGTNITSITGTWPNQTINATTQGGGGGASTLGVNFNGVSITSPTAQINFTGGALWVTATGSTSTVTMSQVSLSTGVTGSLPAASIASGSLGASVIASSISANSGSITAGTNITVSGNWPNQTVNSTGGNSVTASSGSVLWPFGFGTTTGAQFNVTGSSTAFYGEYLAPYPGVIISSITFFTYNTAGDSGVTSWGIYSSTCGILAQSSSHVGAGSQNTFSVAFTPVTLTAGTKYFIAVASSASTFSMFGAGSGAGYSGSLANTDEPSTNYHYFYGGNLSNTSGNVTTLPSTCGTRNNWNNNPLPTAALK